jgi:hypothetical protein
MNPVSIDIKDMLEADRTLGLDYEKNLWVSQEPDYPDNTVTIYDMSGRAPDLTMDNAPYHRPSFQVRVRNNDYEEGMELALNIMTSLHGRALETWNDTTYTVITAMGEPAPLVRDGNYRVLIITNFNVQRR